MASLSHMLRKYSHIPPRRFPAETPLSAKIDENAEKEPIDFEPTGGDIHKKCYICENMTILRTTGQVPVCDSCQHRHLGATLPVFGEKVENSENSENSAGPENPEIEKLAENDEKAEFSRFRKYVLRGFGFDDV